ncbi:hypothetical protein V6U90_08020 [Micromonospora sp. CPCC 206060]|uniref:hypothetical protein n=1 Tax=Micromonospora sp. CPCC 206060 TaxID=3122406 RepID=UPI002FEE93CE
MSITIASGMRLTPARLNRLAPKVARKTASQVVNNSATFVNDTALSVPVEANALYKAHLYIVQNSNTTADFKYQFSAPAGTTLTNWTFMSGNTANWTTIIAPLGGVTGVNGIGADSPLNAWGIVAIGASGGSFTVQWAQNTPNVSDTTVKAGSFLELLRFA